MYSLIDGKQSFTVLNFRNSQKLFALNAANLSTSPLSTNYNYTYIMVPSRWRTCAQANGYTKGSSV